MDKYFDFASGKTFVETGGKYAGERMPLYIKPNHKVSAQELKDCMRDQYEGTPLDITQGPDAGPWNSKLRYGSLGFKLDSVQYWYERPIATQQTAWSFVAQMRGYESAKAGGILWFGVDDAASSLYVPMYSKITAVPECYAEGNGDMYNYSPTSAWWTYNIVANWAYTKYSAMMPDIKKVQAAWEDKFNAQVEAVDAQVADMDAAKATEFLTKYSCAQAQESTAAWKELGIYLFVKYLDGQERKEKDGQFLRNAYGEPEGPNRTPYPTEFLQKIAPVVAHE
jgi:dipeptidase